jgi:hypothetical protein
VRIDALIPRDYTFVPEVISGQWSVVSGQQ